MHVIADMVLAVAVVTVAPGAVAEFQIRMADIGSAADSTAVVVIGFLGCLLGIHMELDDLVSLGLGRFAEFLLHLDAPASGQEIQHIHSKEQEVVGKRNDAEEIAGEAEGEEIQQNNRQIDQGENPGLDGNDEEEQEAGIRIHGGIAKEQAQIQIGHMGVTSEDHAVNIHHQHTGKIEQIEPEGAPAHFHCPAKGIIAEQGNGDEEDVVIACAVGQRIGEEPPDLSPENQTPVKEQKTVQTVISGHLRDDIDDGSAHSDVEHQIGDAFIPVENAEAFKPAAKIFHKINSK